MGPDPCTLAWVGSNLTVGRASLLGLCPNSFHKVEVWACALGLRSRPVYTLFSTPSVAPQPLAEASLGKG